MKVKICGITHPKDAKRAAESGADYIGIVLANSSKRCVTLAQAHEIAHTAKLAGAEPVAVFKDESIFEMIAICQQLDLSICELHGSEATNKIASILPYFKFLFLAFHAGSKIDHSKINTLPLGTFPLFDGPQGGSGLPFHWNNFNPPTKSPWILGGGLNPDNVATAITLLKPTCVTVSTGVEEKNSIKKNPRLIDAFVQAAKKRSYAT